jgi:hypothetical protein
MRPLIARTVRGAALRSAFHAVSTVVVAVALAAPLTPIAAQAAAPGPISIPVALQVGIPQGEFAQGVKIAGGLGGGLIFAMNSVIGLRTDLGVMIYGSETRRVPLGGGALGLINVDVTTTNTIFGGNIGAQVGLPGPTPKPYIGGMIGFSAFTTSSSVEGSNSSDVPFARSTNSSDGTFAKTVLGGFYIPIGKGSTMFDIGARYTWNGEKVRYLTEGDIIEDTNGDLIVTPRETRADLLTITIGVTFRPSFNKPRQ